MPKARVEKAIEVLGKVHGKAWDIIPQLDKYPSGSSRSSRLRADRLGLSATTAVGFCGNLFGVTEEENAVRERELMAFSKPRDIGTFRYCLFTLCSPWIP